MFVRVCVCVYLFFFFDDSDFVHLLVESALTSTLQQLKLSSEKLLSPHRDTGTAAVSYLENVRPVQLTDVDLVRESCQRLLLQKRQ